MKCTIPGLNLKVFGRAVHSLSKIGDELYIEPLEEGLALRTVNSSRSAFACFLFFPSFFQHYDDGSGLEKENDDDNFRCKLEMKSILTVFRSLSTIDKTVEQCKIKLDNTDSRLVFQLHCKHGIVKTHNLAYIECDTLQAVFSKDMSPNVLTSPPRLLCDAVVNFQNNQEEISLTVSPNRVSLKNYTDDDPDQSKVVRTELILTPEEFDNYRIGIDTEITFCLKELRAILAFVEITNLPLNIHFETPGRPVVFTVDSDQTFECSFVLATLAETDQSASQQPTQTFGKKNHSRKNNSKRSHSTQVKKSKPSQSTSRLEHHRPDKLAGDSMEESASITNMTVNPIRVEEPLPSTSMDCSTSPVIPILTVPDQVTPKADHKLQELDEDDEDEEDAVPGTPPSKKFCSLFFGLSQSTQGGSQAPPIGSQAPPMNVLAEDTDEDD